MTRLAPANILGAQTFVPWGHLNAARPRSSLSHGSFSPTEEQGMPWRNRRKASLTPTPDAFMVHHAALKSFHRALNGCQRCLPLSS